MAYSWIDLHDCDGLKRHAGYTVGSWAGRSCGEAGMEGGAQFALLFTQSRAAAYDLLLCIRPGLTSGYLSVESFSHMLSGVSSWMILQSMQWTSPPLLSNKSYQF